MRVIKATLEVLGYTGLTAEEQEIKRAYWRYAKQRNGFNCGVSMQSYKIAEYLKINKKVILKSKPEKRQGNKN